MFNMADMGFRLAQRANGVSQLHGVVSRGMFGGLWPDFDVDERPITSITNGVHAPTWVPADFDLARAHGVRPGPTRQRTAPHLVFDAVDKVPARRSGTRSGACGSVSSTTRAPRVRKSRQQRGAAPAELKWIDSALDPNVLTIGFARRVPSYKRLTLMQRDPARLKRLLLHPSGRCSW